MAGYFGKIQMREFKSWHDGITKKNHISSIYKRAPQRVSDLMVQLLAFRRGRTLETFLSQFPVREFETDDDYIWDVIGSSRKNIALKEARDEDGKVVTTSYEENNGNVGAGTAPFFLVFEEAWFAKGEFIVGNLNEVYQFRILDEPRMEGTDAVYKVELAGGNTDGVPYERLLPGERFSVEAAFVEGGLSRKVGGVRFAAPVSMRNEWSHVRIKHKVSGDMLDSKLICQFPIAKETNGRYQVQKVNTWMHYVDFKVEEQFSDYKNNAIAFSRSNRNKNGEYMNIGDSGEAIRTGAGLFEQIETGNVTYYNKFSLKLIEDALLELSAAKLDFGERVFVMHTGERGAIQFHKAITREVSGWTMFTLDNNSTGVIQKVKSPLHQNALAAGYQFVEYRAPNNVVLKIVIDDYLDDPVRNKMPHPLGGPASSYRYTIFDIGSMDQPNIQKCQIKGRPEYRGYQWGLRNPFTGSGDNPYMSYDEDSAMIHKMATLGVCVLDPTRCFSIIPEVLSD